MKIARPLLPTAAIACLLQFAAFGQGPGCCISSVVADHRGNLYVNSQSSIVRVSPDGRAVNIMPPRTGSQKEAEPFASNVLAIDAQDNLYSAGSARVFRILPGGSFQTLAGSGRSAVVDGVGKAASFSNPRQMAVDASGSSTWSTTVAAMATACAASLRTVPSRP